MGAIYRKELRSYFYSPVGYIFAALMLGITIIFGWPAIQAQYAMIDSIIYPIVYVSVIACAIMSMRSFADERAKKTDQLLLTSPISLTEIVLGKYLAVLTIMGCIIAVSFLIPLIMMLFGEPPMAEFITKYIGLFLVVAVFTAIGVLISSLTESQVAAAVVSAFINFLLCLLSALISLLSSGAWTDVFMQFSVLDRMVKFSNGVINVVDVVFYLSVVFILLFLTVRSLERRRYQ